MDRMDSRVHHRMPARLPHKTRRVLPATSQCGSDRRVSRAAQPAVSPPAVPQYACYREVDKNAAESCTVQGALLSAQLIGDRASPRPRPHLAPGMASGGLVLRRCTRDRVNSAGRRPSGGALAAQPDAGAGRPTVDMHTFASQGRMAERFRACGGECGHDPSTRARSSAGEYRARLAAFSLDGPPESS
jgi:hypothetical protein